MKMAHKFCTCENQDPLQGMSADCPVHCCFTSETTPEEIVLEIVNNWGNAKKGMPDFVKLIKEYATIHAAKAWDAGYDSRYGNGATKLEFLSSLK